MDWYVIVEIILYGMMERFRQLQGSGGHVVGLVLGRSESEDVAIEADIEFEGVARSVLEERSLEFAIHGTQVILLSEHGRFEYGKGDTVVYVALDPLDNSKAYQDGILVDIYGAITIFKGTSPVAGGIVDFVRELLTLRTRDGGLELVSLKEKTRVPLSIPTPKKHIDKATKFGGFTQGLKYALVWARDVLPILEEHLVEARIETYGGAGLYSRFPLGQVEAYIMPGGKALGERTEEPRNEIDPAMAVIEACGLFLGVIDESGVLREYSFDPNKNSERVSGAFIAATSKELAEEIAAELVRS